MALIVETGAGIVGADSYAAISVIDAYWAARPHDALAAGWVGATAENKDGAAREAASFLDALYGPFYRGARTGYIQGLMWPRTGAADDAGTALPDLPPELIAACCDLSARAISTRLSPDSNISAPVVRERKKIGPLEKEIEYADGATLEKKFGVVAGLLTPILNGSQPGAVAATWNWA